MTITPREETQARLDKLSTGVMQHTPEQAYTVADRFEACARDFPERLFLHFEGRSVSYGELNRQANRYAAVARQQGLKRGDVAALMMENRPEFFFVWVAMAKLGVTTALLNPQMRGQTLLHALQVTGSRLLWLGSECRQVVAETVLPVLLVADGESTDAESRKLCDQLAQASDENLPAALREGLLGEHPLWFVFTSGTTGLPKAAILSHMRWLGVGDGWKNLLGITADDVFYCVLPLFHGAAGMSLVSNAVAAGASVVLRRKFSASAFWPDVRAHGVTTLQYIGEVIRYLVNRPVEADEREHTLKRMTGAGVTRDVWLRFQQRFGPVEIYEGWGATESNCNMINVDGVPGACGRIPFQERSNARLVRYDTERDELMRDAAGRLIECQPGEVGEIIGMILNLPGIGAGRFEGYTDPEATERKILRHAFADGDAWYRSGDLFVRDADDYFYFVDRIGDTFRWKSENVSTAELAEVLSAYDDAEIINAYGVRVPGHEGRAGMAAVQMKADRPFDPQVFARLALERLPDYAVPLFVRVSMQADMTATFKLRKVALRNQGYDPDRVREPLFVLDKRLTRYVPYSPAALESLGIPPFAGD